MKGRFVWDGVSVTVDGREVTAYRDRKPSSMDPTYRPEYRASFTMKVTHVDPAFEEWARKGCEDASRQLAEAIEVATERLCEGLPRDELRGEAYSPPRGSVVRRVWHRDRELGTVVVDFDEDSFVTTVRAVPANPRTRSTLGGER